MNRYGFKRILEKDGHPGGLFVYTHGTFRRGMHLDDVNTIRIQKKGTPAENSERGSRNPSRSALAETLGKLNQSGVCMSGADRADSPMEVSTLHRLLLDTYSQGYGPSKGGLLPRTTLYHTPLYPPPLIGMGTDLAQVNRHAMHLERLLKSTRMTGMPYTSPLLTGPRMVPGSRYIDLLSPQGLPANAIMNDSLRILEAIQSLRKFEQSA